jgi:uncharacterized FlaG/YvyC family protein
MTVMAMKIGATENGWQAALPFARARGGKATVSSSEPGREGSRSAKPADTSTGKPAIGDFAEPVKEQPKVAIKAFFAVNDDKEVVIRIVDSQGNVIQQIPSEEMQKMAAEFKKTLAAGDLFNMKA